MSEAAVQQERWRCGKRGGNSTTSRCKRDVGATRDEAMQQPASIREVQCNIRDGGVTREGRVVRQGVAWQGGGTTTARGGTTMARGGMVRGSTTTAQGGTAWGGATKGGMTENYLNESFH